MKACLIFNLPEEREEHENAINGWKYKDNLDELWNRIYRPRHKHGYINSEINTLLEDEKCDRLMDLMEAEYQSLLKEWE